MKRVHPFRTLLVACLLVLSIWGAFSQPAQADKAMKSLAFEAADTVEVVAIYETSYPAQKSLTKSLKTNSKLMKKAAGFKGSAMLQSQDGKQVIAFSQWQDLASYQAYSSTLTADVSKATPTAPAPTRTLVFEVGAVQTSIAGATPALRGKEAVVQLTQFAAKTPEARSQVVAQVEAMIPELLQKQPIPQAVILLKQADSGDMALMTNWNCSALFEDVGKPAAIEPGDLGALADTEQHLYNVVNILPAEVKEPKDSDD